jgi:hypothetical protein
VYGESERDRSRAWVRYVQQHADSDIVLFLAAGRLPFSWRKPMLRELMLQDITAMLLKAGYTQNGRIFSRGDQTIVITLLKKNVWGTFEETLSLLLALWTLGETSIVLFSSSSHLPRIKTIWNTIAPNMMYSTVGTDEDMSDKLQSFESKKDAMNTYFFKAYERFGVRGVDILSFFKNLILNRILAVQER